MCYITYFSTYESKSSDQNFRQRNRKGRWTFTPRPFWKVKSYSWRTAELGRQSKMFILSLYYIPRPLLAFSWYIIDGVLLSLCLYSNYDVIVADGTVALFLLFSRGIHCSNKFMSKLAAVFTIHTVFWIIMSSFILFKPEGKNCPWVVSRSSKLLRRWEEVVFNSETWSERFLEGRLY